jgi:hypothetical protein
MKLRRRNLRKSPLAQTSLFERPNRTIFCGRCLDECYLDTLCSFCAPLVSGSTPKQQFVHGLYMPKDVGTNEGKGPLT